jgi:heme o synthase
MVHPARSPRQILSFYYQMTRPRVLALVLFTGLPVFAMNQTGWPSLATTLWVLLGTALAGAACSVLNAYVERETDARMARTQDRPLPVAAVAPEHALFYGIALSAASTGVLWLTGGPIAALVGVLSILFYVFVYTMWLKPRTPQNIVIGGAAGATTPLIADAALNGSIGMGSLALFLIIFMWTPPHFWAIALYRKKDYAMAGIPMMPNVVGDQPTRWRMLAYSILLIPCTLVPVALGSMSWLYGAAALALGAWFVWRNVGILRAQNYKADRQFFMASNIYLMALFAAMIIDIAVPVSLG